MSLFLNDVVIIILSCHPHIKCFHCSGTYDIFVSKNGVDEMVSSFLMLDNCFEGNLLYMDYDLIFKQFFVFQ